MDTIPQNAREVESDDTKTSRGAKARALETRRVMVSKALHIYAMIHMMSRSAKFSLVLAKAGFHLHSNGGTSTLHDQPSISITDLRPADHHD